jgi:hypothetical protein
MSMNVSKSSRRKQTKLTGGVKVTLAALSVMSFIGGWDLIARLERTKEAKASGPDLPSSSLSAVNPTPTPWPTIAPLPEFAVIPTLVPTLVSQAAGSLSPTGSQGSVTAGQNSPVFQIAPLPTPAPLPTLAPLPVMPAPPPPPPPPQPPSSGSGGGSHRSGGS